MNFVQDHIRNFIDQLQPDFPVLAEYWLANFDETCRHCRDKCRGLTSVFKNEEEGLLSVGLDYLFPGEVNFQWLLSDTRNEEYRTFLCGHIQAILFAVNLETTVGNLGVDGELGANDERRGDTADSDEQPHPQSTADSHAEFIACLSTLRDTALASTEPFWHTGAGEWILGPFYQKCLTIDPEITHEFHQICADAGVNMNKLKSVTDLISLAMSASTNTQKYESLLPRVEEWYKHFGRGTKWWFVPESRYSADTPGICVPATFFADLRVVADHPLISRLEGYGLTREALRAAIDEMGDVFDRDAHHEIEGIFKNLITSDMIQKVVTDIMTGQFGKRSANEAAKYLNPQEKASRERLAAKLAKKLADKRAKKAASSAVKEDSRSIDDLVADIEGTDSGTKGKSKGKRTSK